MLTIEIPEQELFDEENSRFITLKSQKLQLEHSLVSLSKWESKWERAFLGKEPMTDDQLVDYIRCMTITQNVDPSVYNRLTIDNIKAVDSYINRKMTATTFHNLQEKPDRNVVTAEIIYYWMITMGVPMECQKWHLNRLLTLIKVCALKNSPPKKMSRASAMARQRSLNASRRRATGSRG